MSQDADPLAALQPPDADQLLQDLRRQIEAVKAQMAEHREVMQAAGLTATRNPGDGGGAPR